LRVARNLPASGVSKQIAFLMLLIFAAPVEAQRISFGVVGGMATTDAFPNQTSPRAMADFVGVRTWSPFKDYVVGARVEVRVTDRWSVLADGLYREMQGTWAAVLPNGTLNSVSPNPVVTWEIPVLARYRLGGRRMRPFVEAGPSFRMIGNRNSDPSGHGLAAGAGVQFHAGWLTIAPQLRYTRWAADPSQTSRTGPNQVEVLLGLTTGGETEVQKALGGRISIGGTVGTNLANDYRPFAPTTYSDGNYSATYTFRSGTRCVMGGPTVEVHLGRLSIEGAFLRRVLHQTTDYQISNGYSGSYTSTAGVWEIPVMAKYRLEGRFRRAAWRPLVEAGPAFRQGGYLPHFGIASGVGAETRWHAMKIAPAVRYTRWQQSWREVPNEVAVLLGVSF
jgi:hypothetical protein